LLVFVADSDQYYSPARIAGLMTTIFPSLKEQRLAQMFVAFSDENSTTICPGDSRRAIISVAVGDKKHSFSNTLTCVDTNG